MNRHEHVIPVARWVRIGLVAIAVPNLFAGLWAVASPRGWFEDFPGWPPRLVAAEPPYNAHLATDAGAGLLASGLVLLIAAWLADRRSTQLALVAFSAFAIPHSTYHSLNPAPRLSDAQNLQNALVLSFSVVAAVVLFVASGRAPASNVVRAPS